MADAKIEITELYDNSGTYENHATNTVTLMEHSASRDDAEEKTLVLSIDSTGIVRLSELKEAIRCLDRLVD